VTEGSRWRERVPLVVSLSNHGGTRMSKQVVWPATLRQAQGERNRGLAMTGKKVVQLPPAHGWQLNMQAGVEDLANGLHLGKITSIIQGRNNRAIGRYRHE